MFPRIRETITCPIEGYEAYSVRLVVNPTGKEKDAWFAALSAIAADEYTPFGAIAAELLGETRAADLDFATPDAAAATVARDDLPDELLAWILSLPGAVWADRAEDMRKKLSRRLATGS